MDLAETLEILDRIAADRCDLVDIRIEFNRQVDVDDVVPAAASWALAYRLIDPSDEDGRQTHGVFAPLAELGGFVLPPYLETVSSEILAVWEELADAVQSPAIRGRFNDLLWVTHHGEEPHEHARLAIRDYLAATDLSDCDGLEVTYLVARALELSRSLNATDLVSAAISRATAVLDIELELERDGTRPGVFAPLLRMLIDLPEAERPNDLETRLGEAHRLVEEDHPFIREPLLQLEEVLMRGRPEEVARLRRSRVEIWLNWGLQQEGLLRTVELGKALELASNTPDVDDLRETIRRHIQEIDPATQGLKTVSAQVDIPTVEMEELIESIAGSDGLEAALDRFGSWGPPTGDPIATARQVDEQIQNFPMQFLVSQVVSHDAGYPIRYLETDEDKRAAAVISREVLDVSIHAVFAETALDRIGTKYAAKRDQVEALFQTELITAEQADAFDRAFAHYWEGRPDEAIHVALPRIEAVLRRVLVAMGGVVYKEPRGLRPGGVKTLGEVLYDLRLTLDQGWWRFLTVLLVEPLGLNLRNEYLHGLVAEATEQHAALILQAAAYLRLLEVRTAESGGEHSGQSGE
jgi:uncharacterized protein DUF4209